MSIGPEINVDPKLGPSKGQKIVHSVKKLSSGLMVNPAKYLAYFTILGIIIRLLLERSIAWELYVIVGVLGVLGLIHELIKNDP